MHTKRLLTRIQAEVVFSVPNTFKCIGPVGNDVGGYIFFDIISPFGNLRIFDRRPEVYQFAHKLKTMDVDPNIRNMSLGYQNLLARLDEVFRSVALVHIKENNGISLYSHSINLDTPSNDDTHYHLHCEHFEIKYNAELITKENTSVWSWPLKDHFSNLIKGKTKSLSLIALTNSEKKLTLELWEGVKKSKRIYKLKKGDQIRKKTIIFSSKVHYADEKGIVKKEAAIFQ